MKLDVLLNRAGLTLPAGARSRDVLGVVCDSRQVKPGYLFVAIPGVDRNGLQYLEDAMARGASVVVAETACTVSRDTLLVLAGSARSALAELSSAFNGNPSGRLLTIGITGTNGKTTTAFLCRDIMRFAGKKPGMIGTVEYQIGSRVIPASRTTPDAPTLQDMMVQMLASGCDSVVMEASSHSLDQDRVRGIDFDVAVFTNLTGDHLDYHLTMERYFEAKWRLFQLLGTGAKKAAAVINTDDAWGRRLTARAIKGRVLTFGMSGSTDVRILDPAVTVGGSTFRMETPWGSRSIRTNLVGRYNISNAAAAISACAAAGVPFDQACDAVAAASSVPGRLEEVQLPKGYRVFVDYAHTHDALENVLSTLREVTAGRLITVFGCGGNRDKTKRPKMGEVAARLADRTILTSDNPRREDPMDILHQIQEGYGDKPGLTIEADRRAAIRLAVSEARPGDVVLIAGKGHETFQELANSSVPFDDRQVAAEQLQQVCAACW
jgi:UDP-N-acetylmuramoyl-L-alanyl-D-glutamate--2,6-diaminopimelate ligase